MIKCIDDNKQFQYKLFESSFTSETLCSFKSELDEIYKFQEIRLGKKNLNTRWGHIFRENNFFQLSAGSNICYNIFCDLRLSILNYADTYFPNVKSIYMESWINHDTHDLVLDWHAHDGHTFHGYISLDPKDTVTDFNDYIIENKIGQIYVGPSFRKHKVEVKTLFDDLRITIGFNILCDGNRKATGLIPIA